MLVILPFETEIYKKAGVPCEFVGHPLIDELRANSRSVLRSQLEMRDGELAIALLPGSRKKEVERILPPLLKTAELLKKMLPQCRFFLSQSANVPGEVYDHILQQTRVPITVPKMEFQNLVTAMDFAFVASGTATLQTALLGTPFFLVYKASWLTYQFGKRLIKVAYLGLVNLLAGKKVVPEFIQGDMHPATMAHEAKVLLQSGDLYQQMKWEFEEIKENLGSGGASARAAQVILQSLHHDKK